MAILCGWIAFAVYSQAARGGDIDATARQLAAQNAALQQQINDDRVQIGQAQSPAWLEEQARKIGYVLPGESVYVLVTPGASPLPASGGVDAKLPTYTPPTPTPQPSGAPSASPAAVVLAPSSPSPGSN